MLAPTENRKPREIVAAIPKSRELLAIEDKCAQASALFDAAAAALQKAIAKNFDHQFDREVLELARAAEVARQPVVTLKATLKQLHADRAVVIAERLSDIRREAAERIVELIAELREPFATITETMVCIESSGGTCVRLALPWLDDLERGARRISGLVKSDIAE